MPLTISEILATQGRTLRIVHVEGGGFRPATEGEEPLITLTYRLGAVTPRFEAEFEARQSSAAEGDTSWIVPLLVPMLESWDIQTDDGEPFPITENAMQDMPYVLLFSVLDCIQKDAEVPKGSSSTSSGGSGRPKTARKASGAKSRRGTTPSPARSVRRVS